MHTSKDHDIEKNIRKHHWIMDIKKKQKKQKHFGKDKEWNYDFGWRGFLAEMDHPYLSLPFISFARVPTDNQKVCEPSSFWVVFYGSRRRWFLQKMLRNKSFHCVSYPNLLNNHKVHVVNHWPKPSIFQSSRFFRVGPFLLGLPNQSILSNFLFVTIPWRGQFSVQGIFVEGNRFGSRFRCCDFFFSPFFGGETGKPWDFLPPKIIMNRWTIPLTVMRHNVAEGYPKPTTLWSHD